MNNHLYRSRDDRMLAGVAGGLAEMWDADPSLVRIVWALLVVLTGGIALVVYIVMAIVVPEEDDPRVWAGQPNRWDGPAAPAGGTTAEAAAAAPSTAGGDPQPRPGPPAGQPRGSRQRPPGSPADTRPAQRRPPLVGTPAPLVGRAVIATDGPARSSSGRCSSCLVRGSSFASTSRPSTGTGSGR